MMDIILFIPRLILDILKLVWGVVVFVFEFIGKFISVFLPYDMTLNSWLSFGGVVLVFVLTFVLWKSGEKPFAAFFKVILALGVGVGMFALNTLGAIITIVISLLYGFNVLKGGQNLAYMGLGLMWAVMIVMKVMG